MVSSNYDWQMVNSLVKRYPYERRETIERCLEQANWSEEQAIRFIESQRRMFMGTTRW